MSETIVRFRRFDSPLAASLLPLYLALEEDGLLPSPEWRCEDCSSWSFAPDWEFLEVDVGTTSEQWGWLCPRCGYWQGYIPDLKQVIAP